MKSSLIHFFSVADEIESEFNECSSELIKMPQYRKKLEILSLRIWNNSQTTFFWRQMHATGDARIIKKSPSAAAVCVCGPWE